MIETFLKFLNFDRIDKQLLKKLPYHLFIFLILSIFFSYIIELYIIQWILIISLISFMVFNALFNRKITENIRDYLDYAEFESFISKLSGILDGTKSILSDGFDIEMDCITHMYEYNVENTRLISEQLSEIGINVSVNGMSIDEFNKKVVMEKNTSLWLVGWGTISVDGGVVYDYFIRPEGENLTGFYNSGHYVNIEVDRLGAEASTEMDPKKRLKLLQEGFRIAIVDDVIIIPLFSQELFVLTADYVDIQPRADLKLVVENIEFK